MGSAVVKVRDRLKSEYGHFGQQYLEREKQSICYRSIMTGDSRQVSVVYQENNCSLSSLFSFETFPNCCCCRWLKSFEMRTVLVQEALDYSETLSWDFCHKGHIFAKMLDSGRCHCIEDHFLPVQNPESTHLIRFTALQLASYHGLGEIVKLILECTKASLNYSQDKTPLMMAASSCVQESSSDIALLLIEHGARVNCQDLHGNTALHYATLSCQPPDLVRLLLQHHANKDAQNSSGQTALWLSAAVRCYSCAELLVSADANVNDENLQMSFPLMRAILNKDPQMVKLLLKSQKCDVNIVDRVSKQPLLHQAILAQTFGGSTPVEIEIINLLLENGAHCDSTDGFYRNALIIAILRNNFDLISLLIQRGCDVNWLADEFFNPCHAAAFIMANNRLQILKLLHEHGAKLNMRTTNGNTAILYAININSFDSVSEKMNTLETVAWLISHGCNPDFSNSCGETALWKATVSENENLVDLLIYCNVRLSVYCSSRVSRLDSTVGSTPLQVAYLTKNVNVAHKFLRSGVDMNLERWFWEGSVPSISRGNSRAFFYLQQYAINAEPLKFICRNTIRKFLGTRLTSVVAKLGLPKLLEKFVLLGSKRHWAKKIMRK